MSIDSSALATNANKLDEYINKNEKQDIKDKQLYDTIERKVKKEEHKHKKPRGHDGTLKECKRLVKEGANPEVLIKLGESFGKQEKYYRYYVQCFLPALGKVIERSKTISNETKKQVISEITKSCLSRYNEQDSGYGSDFEDEINGISDSDSDVEDEVNGTPDNDVQLLKGIKNGNNRKFRKYLKDCTNVSGITDEKGNNVLHLITSLEKKQKCKFLGTLIKTVTKEDLAQLVDSKNQEGKTPFQAALINKIIKEEHESNTVRSSDNTLKFLAKLLKYGAKLSLPTEDLEKLSKKQNEYYLKFLEKLAERKPKIKTKVEEVIAHTINTPDSNDNYQLHLAIKNKDEKSFKELLQKGADISLKDTDGNNALHLIVLELKQKRKFEFSNIILNVSEEEEKAQLKVQFKEAINAENIAKQTPLHQLLQYIRKKSESQSLTDKEFKGTTRYKTLELFLQNDADITAQDKEGNNILHHIALLKGEQKISCLNLILDLVEKGVISSEKLHKAINAKNEDDKYPAQIALIRQTEKIPSKLKDFSRRVRSRPTKHYYTAKFCAELLQNGAENKSDHITIPKEHRKQKYYQTIKRIKDITGVSPDQETQKELEERFSKKNAHKNINLPVGWILGGFIFATVFCALAGNMIAAAALSVTIAVCAMCYPIYLKLENAFNAKAQKPSDQPEHTESPSTKMNDISILRQFINKLDGLTNKFSFPGQ